MTNKEKFISSVATITFVDKEVVEKLFEIVNERDWAIFCSQMGDYDHPGERVAANEKFNQKVHDMVDGLSELGREAHLYVIDLINHSEFYSKHFHTMNEEASE